MRGMLRRCGAHRPQLFIVLAVAGVAAGCSNTSSRLATAQLFAASNNPAATTGAVEQRPLGPLGAQGVSSASAYASPGASPIPAGVNVAGLRARGWSLENAPIVEVTGADTAVTLSQGYGVPVGVILEANGMTNASEITAGRRLVIPTYVRRDTPATTAPTSLIASGPGAPPTTLNEQAGLPPVNLPSSARLASGHAAASKAPLPAGGHQVVVGETLWSISERYGVPPHDIIALNNLPPEGTVRTGQVLRLSANAPAQQVQVASVDPKVVNTGRLSDAVAPALAQPQAPATTASLPSPAAATAPPTSPAPTASEPKVVDDGGTGFRWPVRGRLITGFGKQADGARNDGINLAVPAGTPVRAASAGTVIYAGNELEGYGNLVLVQHDDDWVSAYAHNEALKVSRGDTVKRGQTIAAAGSSGSVDQPQLHFELRKRSKPVDPLPHLGGA